MDGSIIALVSTDFSCFKTNQLLFDTLEEHSFYFILPDTRKWTLENLLIFINQLPDTITQTDRIYKPGPIINLPLSYQDGNHKYNIICTIDIRNYVIDVKCHREILLSFFQRFTETRFTDVGSRDRPLIHKNSKRNYITFYITIRNRERGNRFISTLEQSLMIKKSDFQISIQKVVCILSQYFNRIDETECIFCIKEIFYQVTLKPTISSLNELVEKVGGILHIFRLDCLDISNFESCTKDGETFSMSHGIFLSRYAQAILTRNHIDGLIMDTTFRLLPKYVSAFIFGVFRNTGIPLGITFTKSECKLTYSMFYDYFYWISVLIFETTQFCRIMESLLLHSAII
jgi:hypothetical protein